MNASVNINIDFKQFVKVYDCQYIMSTLTLTYKIYHFCLPFILLALTLTLTLNIS